MIELQPFNRYVLCPKCHHDEIAGYYCEGGRQEAWIKCQGVQPEHLHQRCKNCGYCWFEETAEARH